MTSSPIENEIFCLADCLASYSTLLDELAERLQLLAASQHGPVEMIEAATIDIVDLLERVEAIDGQRRSTVQTIAERLDLEEDGMRLEDIIAAVVTTQALELTAQRWRLIAFLQGASNGSHGRQTLNWAMHWPIYKKWNGLPWVPPEPTTPRAAIPAAAYDE